MGYDMIEYIPLQNFQVVFCVIVCSIVHHILVSSVALLIWDWVGSNHASSAVEMPKGFYYLSIETVICVPGYILVAWEEILCLHLCRKEAMEDK